MSRGSSPPALSEASAVRVLVLANGTWHDVFDVVDATDHLVRARSPYLFEVGETLKVRIERGDGVIEACARVRAHTGPDDARVTELELITTKGPH